MNSTMMKGEAEVVRTYGSFGADIHGVTFDG